MYSYLCILKYFSKHVRHIGVNDDDDLPMDVKVIPPKEIFEMVESKRIDRQALNLLKHFKIDIKSSVDIYFI
jgi:hypothetical protein